MNKIYFILLILLSLSALADWNKEEKKIEFLIAEVSKVDGVFIRNSVEHTPEEASAHLKMKYQSALNSWFTPKKEKWTAKLFIDKVASKSSISSKDYQIKFKDNKVIKAKEWFNKKLEEFQK